MTDEKHTEEADRQDHGTTEYSKRRRSERLFLTLPIRVHGTSPKGRDFTEDCVSINVSRHGARIRMKNALTVDDVVHITNLKNDKGTTFRVIGRVSEPQPDTDYDDWGVESVDTSINIWGVELRDNPLEETAFSAVLQCSSCQIMSSFLLTHKEVGAAGASSYITRNCPRCMKETLWTVVSSDRREMATAKPLAKAAKSERRGEERRNERRFALQVPIRVRTAEGDIEISATVNLSRKGARFLAAKDYSLGSVLYVTVPYEPGQEPIEVRASVEHIEEDPAAAAAGGGSDEADKKGAVQHVEPLPGSPKKLYGIKFV